MKYLTGLLCSILLMASDNAFATTCMLPHPKVVVEQYDTIFLAFITEGRFLEAEDPNDCGSIEGSFEVVEELKGDAHSVSSVVQRIVNCDGRGIVGTSDRFPIGKYVMLATSDNVAKIGSCTPVWGDARASCVVDDIRRLLAIHAPYEEMRQWCAEDERSKRTLSYLDSLLLHISELEHEQKMRAEELENMRRQVKEELEKLENDSDGQ